MKLLALAKKLSNKYSQSEMFEEDNAPLTVRVPPMAPPHDDRVKSKDIIVAEHLISTFDKMQLLTRGESIYLQKILDEEQNSKQVLATLMNKMDEFDKKLSAARKEVAKWEHIIR